MDLDPEVHRHIYLHGPPEPAAHRADLSVGVARREHLASRHVLEKLGLGYQGLRFHYGLNPAFYELARAAYLEAAASGHQTDEHGP